MELRQRVRVACSSRQWPRRRGIDLEPRIDEGVHSVVLCVASKTTSRQRKTTASESRIRQRPFKGFSASSHPAEGSIRGTDRTRRGTDFNGPTDGAIEERSRRANNPNPSNDYVGPSRTHCLFYRSYFILTVRPDQRGLFLPKTKVGDRRERDAPFLHGPAQPSKLVSILRLKLEKIV
jgi:hypothetical protein